MTEYKVARLSDLANNSMLSVEVANTTLLLSRIDGAVYAVSGKCTHYGAPLADGALSDGQVICPWHHACFDVRTGAHVDPPGLNALTRYDVRIDASDIYVRVPDNDDERPPTAPETITNSPIFVILGGGIAGENAAETLRAEGFNGRIIMLSKEPLRPYNRTDLSKQLESANDLEALQLRDARFFESHHIEFLTKEVTHVDARQKQIEFADGDSLTFDKLLIATGSQPRQLNIDGHALKNIYQLRTPADAKHILNAAKKGSNAVLIGSSFITLELAAALQEHAVSVRIVAPESVPFETILGERVGKKIQRNHEQQGTRFHLGHKPEAFKGNTHVTHVVLDDGTTLECDFVVVGVGVTPVTAFVSGVSKTDDGGIIVDDTLQATTDVYAAGDIAAFPLAPSGERVRIEHWRVAAQHGRSAARNMLGQHAPYTGVPYFWSAQPELKLRYVGHAETFDDIHYHGNVEEGSFIAYYTKNNQIKAAAGVNHDKHLAAIEHLMKQNKLPDANNLNTATLLELL